MLFLNDPSHVGVDPLFCVEQDDIVWLHVVPLGLVPADDTPYRELILIEVRGFFVDVGVGSVENSIPELWGRILLIRAATRREKEVFRRN